MTKRARCFETEPFPLVDGVVGFGQHEIVDENGAIQFRDTEFLTRDEEFRGTPSEQPKESNLQLAENEILEKIRARVEHPMLFDLGSGQVEPAEGFIGLDLYPQNDRTMKCDLFSEPWAPWRTVTAYDINREEEREVTGFIRLQDETADYLVSSHFVEHVPDWDLHFREAWRILKPGGFYKIVGPYYKSDRYFQDPDHKQPLLAQRFAYLDQQWLRDVHQEHNRRADMNFKVVFIGYAFHEDFIELAEETKLWHLSHSWNAVDDIAVILCKVPLLEPKNGVD